MVIIERDDNMKEEGREGGKEGRVEGVNLPEIELTSGKVNKEELLTC